LIKTNWENEPDIDNLRRMYDLFKTEPGKAVAGLEALANRRSMMSMWYLADAYCMGTYVPKDIGMAKYWYSQADLMGSAEAALCLGRICIEQGNNDEALAAFTRGANREYSPAIYRLAKMYQDGLGTKKDMNRCRALLEKATSKGHVFAKRDLATLYIRGDFGPMFVIRGLALFASLVIDIFGLTIQAIRRGPLDDRVLG
jgi:TPR repeat protein